MTKENKQRLKEYQKIIVKQKDQHKKLLLFFFALYKNEKNS